MEIAVIQSDGLIPIVDGRGGRKAISRGLRRVLIISLNIERKPERLAWIIVEIVLGSPVDSRVVVSPKGLDLRLGQTYLAIVTGNVIRDKIYNDLQSGLMTSLQQSLKFRHPFRRIISKIWVDIVVVCYGVWRTGRTFHYLLVGSRTTIGRHGCGVPDHTRKPDMTYAQRLEIRQSLRIKP